MTAYRAVLVVLLVVSAGAAAPAGATDQSSVGSTGSETVAIGQNATVTNNSTNNFTLGADISSFMQASASEAEGAVDTGMWTARFNATENRSQRVELIEHRTADLREQLDELQQRKDELLEKREAGDISETAYTARIGALVGEIKALNEAINSTAPRARQVNASGAELDSLRTRANNLTGPEIAAVARNASGVSVDNVSGGPPSDAGGAAGENGRNGDGGPPDDAGAADNTTDAASDAPPASAREAPLSGNASANATDETPTNGSAPGNASAPDGNGQSGESPFSVSAVSGPLSAALGVYTYPASLLGA
ncbi:hypothetical protein BRC82_02995 [Halobacteriales archaeon QS_1_67_19]|nr:MAG: hypothetical protein BRC82_02995 [Halobacteriales archaeon QS_1_67_19]